MMGAAFNLIVFDDDESSKEKSESDVVQCEMHNGTLALLAWGVCRLKD